jgi:hypothetical protein
VAFDLDAAPIDWVELSELIDTSYRRVAHKRMIKALDGRGPAGDEPGARR